MPLLSLIYVSSDRGELGSEEITRLLESCIRHNTKQQVTGMLLYLNRSFMQVLEGEKAAVDETYARVRVDPRHSGLILIDYLPINARSFGQWSMCFKRLGASEVAAHTAYVPYFNGGFDAASLGVKDGTALSILKKFAAVQRG